ncbi:hypothetical protein [Flavobacterium sp. 2]|uniref:hypothetical protein n=1 Tax=Flavobacterium sp. 2 TaxID=308053 RepID=UPI003CF2ED12
MKLLYFIILCNLTLNAQNGIGIGTSTPHSSAVLELSAGNKGFLLPRVGLNSVTDITTVASPGNGLIIYNNGSGLLTSQSIYQWNGTLWKQLMDQSTSLNGDVINSFSSLTVKGIRNNPVLFTSLAAGQLLRFDGTTWVNSNDFSGQNWLLIGNSATSGSNFLGTIDDVKMTLKSNNQTYFEFGRRQTLGLTVAREDYTNDNQLVTHLRSALQFEAPNALTYKPMFFVNSLYNFRLKGSAASNDYFEIGAAGNVANSGSCEVIIGDEGDEPIVFQKLNASTAVEMMSMQGTGLNSQVRVGINKNAAAATSILEVKGSISKRITSVSADLILTDIHHTVVITGGTSTVTATLPAASTCQGRVYIIRNTSGSAKNISSYLNLAGVSIATLANNTTIWIQSDGTNWLLI